jgi:hypothetical protein
LIGTRMDLPRRALVGSRTGSSGQCEADPDRLGSDIKLDFRYVVEDINTHLLQKNHRIWLGRSPETWSSIWGSSTGRESSARRRQPRGVGRCFRGWGGRGKVPHLYRREARVCFGLYS